MGEVLGPMTNSPTAIEQCSSLVIRGWLISLVSTIPTSLLAYYGLWLTHTPKSIWYWERIYNENYNEKDDN